MSAILTPTRPAELDTSHHGLDDVAAEFALLSPRLIGIAYRIVGRWCEAEDIVQDAWVRWQTYDRSLVVNSTAFLVTTTTRLAINVAQSARVRHESSVGSWLDERVDAADDPALPLERSEAIELAVLLLVQRLTPSERVAFVLRQSFDYPYSEIAELLHITEANARQLVSRAQKHIRSERQQNVSPAEHQRLTRVLVAAVRAGEVAELERLFAADSAVRCSR